MSQESRRKTRLVSVAVGGTAIAVAVAGCGGGSSGSSASTTANNGSGATTRGASFDSVSGKVIAASSDSASVQQTSGPTSINFDSSTRFTSTSTTTRSSLAMGDCVMVSATSDSTPKGGSTSSTPSAPEKVTAKSVTVTSTSGCQQAGNLPGGGGGFNGTPRSGFTPPEGGFNGTPPSGGFTGSPPAGGFNRGNRNGTFRGRFGGGAFGTIASISGSSFVVTSSFGGTDAKTTVKTTSSTTYDATRTASAADVAKGSCISAVGTNDAGGVLQARSISISSPVNGECPAASVFGGGRGFGGGGFGGRQPNPEGGTGGV